MILSKQLFQEKLKCPPGHEKMLTYQLIAEMGCVNFPYSGFPLFLPIGLKVLKKIREIIASSLEYYGFSEIYAPLIQDEKYLTVSGRIHQVKKELFYLKDKNFFMTPTNEEFFLDTFSHNLSYRHLPIRFFQIADKFRNIKKSKGILRSKQFLMCDAISIDADEGSLAESKKFFELAVGRVCDQLALSVLRCAKNDGLYVDYLIECPEGETKLRKTFEGKIVFEEDNPDVCSQKNSSMQNILASSIAMYFIFDTESLIYATHTSPQGKREAVKMGTYGFGLQRCFHALVHQSRDSLGINWPKKLRPFDITILPIDTKNEMQVNASLNLYEELKDASFSVMLDERQSVSLKERATFSDFMGVPLKIFIGHQEIKTSHVMIGTRRNALKQLFPHTEIIQWLNHYLAS